MTAILDKEIKRGKANTKMTKLQRMLVKGSLQWTSRKPELGSREKAVTVVSPDSRGVGEAALSHAPVPFGSDPSNVASVRHSRFQTSFSKTSKYFQLQETKHDFS